MSSLQLRLVLVASHVILGYDATAFCERDRSAILTLLTTTHAFVWVRQTLKGAPSLGRSRSLLMHGSLGPLESVSPPNGISIGSTVFALHTVVPL